MPPLGRAIRTRRWRRQHVPVTPVPPGRPPVAITTPTNMMGYRDAGVGARFAFILTGNRLATTVWGDIIYTDDSNLSAAAVHAGVLTNGQTGVVVIELVNPPTTQYDSATRNGVTSYYWPKTWTWAYRFIAGVSPPTPVPEYTLEAYSVADTAYQTPITRVNEGQAFIVVLRTKNVPLGTTIPYTLSGFSGNDVVDGSDVPVPLTGSFVVGGVANGNSVDGRGTLYLKAASDTVFGENEVITIALNNGKAVKTVAVADLSPTYLLTTSAASINEGQVLTVTLQTTNVANGTNVPYTITSPQGLDIFAGVPYALSYPHPMAGNFFIQNNTATQSFDIKTDNLTEGDETFTLRLNNAQATVSALIYDTSRTPPPPIIRPPIRPVVTATMVIRGVSGSSPSLTANASRNIVVGPVPPLIIGQYTYFSIGRIVALDINIKNAPLFTTLNPQFYYSTNLLSWVAIPNNRTIWISRYAMGRRFVSSVVKYVQSGPIGASNSSASANYRIIDNGFAAGTVPLPTLANYLQYRPSSGQEYFSFWPFFPQDNRLGITNVTRYYKLVLPAEANNLEFIWRMY